MMLQVAAHIQQLQSASSKEETTLNYHTPGGGSLKALYNFQKGLAIKKCKCVLHDSNHTVGSTEYILDMYMKI